MKIVQVIDQLSLGGAERVCLNLVNLFYRKGYDVKLILFKNKGKLLDFIDQGVDVVFLKENQNKIQAYKNLIEELEDADIVHVHMRQNYRFVRKAMLFKNVKKPVIFHDHYGKIAIKKRVPLFYKSLLKPHFYIGCSKLLTDWAVH